jgi:hypothetical protein
MSLWRKRNVKHFEQKHDNLLNPLDRMHEENVRLDLYKGVYDLSIKSDDLSIKSWVGLTDEDRKKLAAEQHDWEGLCSAVEARLMEKNA